MHTHGANFTLKRAVSPSSFQNSFAVMEFTIRFTNSVKCPLLPINICCMHCLVSFTNNMTQKHSMSASTKNHNLPSTPPCEGETSTSPSAFSPETVHAHLITPSPSSKYAGFPLSIKDFEFRSAKLGDILVAKEGQESEFIMRGIFQITCNDFFFMPDGSYKPGNAINSQFKDVKLSCHLAAPPPNTYAFAVTDFPTCVENLRNLEKIIKPDKKDEITSSLTSSVLGSIQIKLSHALFEVCTSNSINLPSTNDPTRYPSSNPSPIPGQELLMIVTEHKPKARTMLRLKVIPIRATISCVNF